MVFLLKSSACLAIFLMFYKLLLEKERMHTFKRFYLLAALVMALIIPSITFTDYVQVPQAPISKQNNYPETISTHTVIPSNDEITTLATSKNTTNYWPFLVWSVYGLGVLLFTLKFLYNLRWIARNVRNNHKVNINPLTYVLLQDAVVPHTFLNYIFLHRPTFEAGEIPKDVLVHEATHALQKHSLDILFVELLQIVFWFNPLFLFAKKTIKLNHEFLADAEVLKQGSATSDYQSLLLTFASSADNKNCQPSIVNAINYSSYSSIKKRFAIMKRQNLGKGRFLLKRYSCIPLLILVFYGFSSRTIQVIRENIYQNDPARQRYT